MELTGGAGLALWGGASAGLAAGASGLKMGRGAKGSEGPGLASVGRSPTICTLKKMAAERTEMTKPVSRRQPSEA